MNEENRKKREWVKSAAIVFLAVMLVLTFFSNTIMNYSLPEVATQRIMSGSITAKVRGTGTVESGDPYNVEVKESRKVASVVKRAGDEVEIGDVILYLEETDSEELKVAEQELKGLRDAYESALLKGIDSAIVNRVQSGRTPSTSEYLKQINAAQAAIDAAENNVKEYENLVAALNSQIESSSQVTVNASVEKQYWDEALLNLNIAQLEVERAQSALDSAQAVSGGDAASAEQNLKNKKEAAAQWEREAKRREQIYRTAEANVNAAQAESETVVKNLKEQLEEAEKGLKIVQDDLAQKTESYSELLQSVDTERNLASQLETIHEKEAEIEKLRDQAMGVTITAPIAGKIMSISVQAGQNTTPGTPVVVIQPAGKGYTLSFSVTNEQAQRISVGDPAELVNSWWYNDITAKVVSIRPDPDNPSKNKRVTFELSGDLTAGQSLSLSVGQKSANYDMIVPNSAIREDNNGKFILIVEQKSSPLGNRFKATRIDVEVIASDDTQSAIRGGVYGYEDVITTSTKPVEAGQLIRLPD
ncbi:MAG: HlyD family efflux transporter periplasmic adaptor subunit [Lachnospiraceae bacterium]|nr:HlyD family efflux transporter periplasmic adaptor subunit [Lachnospiraceae bacterium]